MVSILETKRLILRQFELKDAQFILDLVNSPGWLEFVGERNIKTEEAAIHYLRNGPIKSYLEHGFGLSLVELKDGTPVGMCGLLQRDSLNYPDLGFAFLPEFMGMGLAFEIANATMNYARDNLKLQTIFAVTVSGNKRSIRLLEKIGFKFKQTIYTRDKNEELMLFRM
jgi:RimJ/RimL family protein N-acetyltransferase